MTPEQKIQLLTGATAAVLFNGNDRFIKFETITADKAEELITSGQYIIEIATDGYLCIGFSAYFGTRMIFADKSLAAIATA